MSECSYLLSFFHHDQTISGSPAKQSILLGIDSDKNKGTYSVSRRLGSCFETKSQKAE